MVVLPWAAAVVAVPQPLRRKRRSCGKGGVLECGSAQSDVLLVKERCQCFLELNLMRRKYILQLETRRK